VHIDGHNKPLNLNLNLNDTLLSLDDYHAEAWDVSKAGVQVLVKSCEGYVVKSIAWRVRRSGMIEQP